MSAVAVIRLGSLVVLAGCFSASQSLVTGVRVEGFDLVVEPRSWTTRIPLPAELAAENTSFLPESPDRERIYRKLSAARASLEACTGDQRGVIAVTLVIDRDGRVTGAETAAPALSACVVAAFANVILPVSRPETRITFHMTSAVVP